MSSLKHTSIADKMREVSEAACKLLKIASVSHALVDQVVSNALDPLRLINSLAEVWHTTPDRARSILDEHGLGGVLAGLAPDVGATGGAESAGPPLSKDEQLSLSSGIGMRSWNPTFGEPVTAAQPILDSVGVGLEAFQSNAVADPLAVLYRDRPMEYAESFLANDAPKMDAYIRARFGETGPRYVVNSGIGANEQFNYFVSALANARSDPQVTWILANSPKEVAGLPADATVENTLFMEFSRSGLTEETVKLHELTPRTAKRIVFANAGPLRELGERDENLVLELPGEVSGRYGRNKTPILMAPMHVVGLDVRAYWKTIADACTAWDLADSSPPVILARYIRTQQLRREANHIYFGTNDPLLRSSADEFCQFWNEGVNRDGNDIAMSRYLGLPRDSHMNLEAVLGTSERKLAVFLLYTGEPDGHPLLGDIDPIRKEHRGLTPGETDLILAMANFKRCSEKMPTILVTVDNVDLTASAVLGQLWADTTLVYSRMIGVDPGSNPEVKAVRTRATEWLANKEMALRMTPTSS